nr:MAG TPA: hypothetical protein [Caudoviricetes sp.]
MNDINILMLWEQQKMRIRITKKSLDSGTTSI